MSSQGMVPMYVLTQALSDAINERRVRAGLFATFSFDPGFFELNILPTLFDQSFSQVDKVRLMQLEDALRSIEHLAVYYNRNALSQDAEPARLDYRRIDVRRATGAFHPKLILLLVDEVVNDDKAEEIGSGPPQSLIVAVQSANLTRSGWWENVECAHIEEILDAAVSDKRNAFRPDLLAILRRIEQVANPEDDHGALRRIRTFLKRNVQRDRVKRSRAAGKYHTRLFGGLGKNDLSAWLADLGLYREDWNLEIISPYFDPTGPGPLKTLLETFQPRQTRVYLPRDPDGTALVEEETYRSVQELGAYWARLPGYVVQRSSKESGTEHFPRRVHAKVYRFWQRDSRDLLVVGSANLTASGHSHGGSGNLEAAFFIDVSDAGYPRRWWLTKLDNDVNRFVDSNADENEGLESMPIDLSLSYDWGTATASYRWSSDRGGFELAETTGATIVTINHPRSERWVALSEKDSARVAEILRSTSFLLVRHDRGEWRVLVREENMGYRPSMLAELTPEEILEYWSLLSPEQRAHFLELRGDWEETLEGLHLRKNKRLDARGTLFDRFAGIYHAFGCLKQYIDAALEEGREREAEARLFGAKYDSLPSLLQKTIDNDDWDPVVRYVTFLCARQLRDGAEQRWPSLFESLGGRSVQLDQLIGHLETVRRQLPLSEIEGADAFLDWYEPAFLTELGFADNNE